MVVVKASATKISGAKYGIAFSRKTPDAPLLIRTVREESPFANKGLEFGMVVTKVNNEDMTWMGPRDAAKVLQRADVGSKMKVEAATLHTAKAKKPRKKSKCGIWLKNSTKAPGVFISQINEDSLFAGTDLEMGMKIVQINGKPCHDDMDFHAALDILKKASGTVEIVALDTPFKGKMERMLSSKSSAEMEETKPTITSGLSFFSSIPGLTRVSSTESSEDGEYKPFLDKLFPTLVDL